MNKKRFFAFKPLTHALILAALLPESYALAATNFTITPQAGTTLPTTVMSGQTIAAYFTVHNNTSTARNGYSIVGLPSTVTQNSGGTNCPSIINLAGSASCTLVLEISGAAKGNFAICKQNSCTSACEGLNVSVTSATTNLVAAGHYTNAGAVQFPLLAHSTITTPWTYPITSNPATLPANFVNNGQFLSASCSGNTCIAGGSYSNLTTQYPLLAKSNDGGNTWNYPSTIISNLPSDYLDLGVFNGTSCQGSTCIAAGEDVSATQASAILAQSNDSGANWTYPIGNVGTLPADFTTGAIGQFLGASCSSQSCIAVGVYTNNLTVQYPLLAQAPLGQLSYTFPIYSGGTLPVDYTANGTFNSGSCSGNICIAGGSYTNPSTTQFPLLGLSINAGVTWTYPIYSGGALPGDFSSEGVFNGVSCFGQMCIAAGAYQNTSHQFPLLAQSTNGGATFTYPIYAGGSLPPATIAGGSFTSASCASNICIAGGSYSDGITQFPLLAQSTNGGATWTYPVYSGGILPLDYVSAGVFNSVSCGAQNTCIAVGSYISTTVDTQLLLIESTDGGTTWTYPSSIISQEPGDYLSGAFAGSAVTPFKKKIKGLTSQVRDALKIRGK